MNLNEIVKTVAWETTDGTIFREQDKQEAQEHQLRLDFLAWYENCHQADDLSSENFLDWLDQHWYALGKFMNKYYKMYYVAS
jgi:hypothetical protein